MLTSNGIGLADKYTAPMPDSSNLLSDPEALRARYAQDGFLRFTNVLSTKEVFDAREAYMKGFPSTMFMRGTSKRAGIFSGTNPSDLPMHGHEGHPAHAYVRTADFDRFAKQDFLYDLSAKLLGAPTKQLQRRPVRHFTKSNVASRAHADLSYVDRGTADVVTAWIPMGDCTKDMGSLVYLEGSHLLGVDKIREMMGDHTDSPHDRRRLTHDLQELAERTGKKWFVADFWAGDLVVHNPYIVHASLDCQSDRMRLSTDVRFVRAKDEVDHRWLRDWSGSDGY